MSYFQLPDAISRRWNETYRTANDYFRTATNNVKFPSVVDSSSTLLQRHRHFHKERLLRENMDVLIFVGTSLFVRVSLFFFRSQHRRGIISARRSGSSNRHSSSSIETIFYYLASLSYMLMPLLPAMQRPRGTLAPYYDRLQSNRELLLFSGTALLFRFVYWKFRPPPSSASSRRTSSSDWHDDSQIYQIKVQNGFKDPKLHQFIDTCKARKETLQKVGNPEDLRRQKLERLRKENLAATANKGPLQLSNEKLLIIRTNLNKVY